ncbi:MAG: S8 family serine peptidase [Anaerolineae bacterium]|nr:S8 family serine peptidase [Anaerolineae bacterium]
MRQSFTLLAMLLLLLGILVVSVQAGEQKLTQNQVRETYKVIAEPGALDPDDPGVTLLADYGAFQLFSVAAGQPVMNRVLDHAVVANDMDWIEINGHVLDTQGDLALPIRFDPSPSPMGKSLQLIQFVGPVKDGWLAAVAATGSDPIQYIANNGYLVWADENGRSQLNALHNEQSFVQFNAPLPAYLKLSPDLVAEMDMGGETAVIPIIIQMVQHPEQMHTEAIIEDLLITQDTSWQPVLKFQTIYGTVHQSDIDAIAQLSDVYWLGLQRPFALQDERQGQILAGSITMTGPYSAIPAGPGYLAWLDSYGFSKNPNDYPIVDITDDGIGTGSADNAAGDQTLRQFGMSGNSSRIAYIGNCTSASNGGGVGGHGHLNMSIAGGYDSRSGFPYRDSLGYQLGLGINPYGRFGGTRVFYYDFTFGATRWDDSNCGDSYVGIIKQNQDSGARISNNSWGNSSTIYGTSAQAYDVGVRDADLNEAGNQELTYIFSAGNQGSPGTIGNPATAKNVITVGASEGYRPYNVDGCGTNSYSADDVMDIVSFSSQGPAAGNRVKPELVAPGSHIQATASTNPLFNGNTICGAENNDGELPSGDAYFPAGQSVFTWSSGTSHSAPAVAGIASLYYYWLENNYHLNAPSPAMMKAYLMAHTLYLRGAGANDTLPSNRQGYGLPDMDMGLEDTPRILLDQQTVLGKSGEVWQGQFAVLDPAKPVRIVMAYTDAAGAVGTSPQVNDLNLQVATPTSSYFGNVFQGQWSVVGGSRDSKNNYEAVFLPAGTTDMVDITVTAFNIAGDGVPNNGDQTDQDFALVCYNCAEVLEVIPASQAVCVSAGRVMYEVTAVSAQDSKEVVTYTAADLPPNTTAVFNPNPITLPESSTLTISNLASSSAGKYLINVSGKSALTTRTTQAGLELFSKTPGSSTLISPVNGATGQPVVVDLSWQAAPQGYTYAVEVALDNSFTEIVASETGLMQTHYQLEGLAADTIYYWRVRASNGCGDGVFSQPFSFTVQDIVYLPVIFKN